MNPCRIEGVLDNVMKTHGRNLRRAAALVSLAALLPSCARIIHPERVGNNSGVIDVGPLVIDILLFIPGLIPGLIAIAVDFGSGAIYVQNDTALGEDGRRFALETSPSGQHEIVLLDADGVVLARGLVEQDQAERGTPVELTPVRTALAQR